MAAADTGPPGHLVLADPMGIHSLPHGFLIDARALVRARTSIKVSQDIFIRTWNCVSNFLFTLAIYAIREHQVTLLLGPHILAGALVPELADGVSDGLR